MAAYTHVTPDNTRWLHLRRMTPSECEAFVQEFNGRRDQAIALMQQRLASLSDLDPSVLDGTVTSLREWWSAARPLLRQQDDRGGFANDPPPMWWDKDDLATRRLRPHSLWLMDGLIQYLTRCVLGSSDALWTEWERNDTLEVANQPCVVGFVDGDRYHCIYRGLRAVAGALAVDGRVSPNHEKYRGDGGLSLEAGLQGWLDRSPAPGADRLEVVWRVAEKPYGLSDVDVSRRAFADVENWLDEVGHDWDGAWVLSIPESIIGYLQSRKEYARILEEAITTIHGVRRAVWVEKVVYLIDAPGLDAQPLRHAVVNLLNTLGARASEP